MNSKVSVSKLVQWQVATAAGLRDKEEKLVMSTSLAETQKGKIEELRKANEMLTTDIARNKEENETMKLSLSSTKEELEVFAKQVKIVKAQISKIEEDKT